jgi:hypothetical protein
LGIVTVVLAASLIPTRVAAKGFHIGEVEGLVDIGLSYGILARTEERNPDFIGIANGGSLPTVNNDDGNLNYDPGLVSNMVRVSGDLTLVWRNFGAFVRGYGFYDFATELDERARTDLSGDARDGVGAGGELQEYYLSARVTAAGIPLKLRVGNQVINWGESTSLRFGVDVVNPLDFVALFQPTTTIRDLFIPQGMIWGAANVSENVAIEGFYQYDWEPVRLPPVGWNFSVDDLIGGDGLHYAMTGGGQYSDLGTDLAAAFGPLPPGIPDFDPLFMRIPAGARHEPRSQGQGGFTVQAIVPALNASKLALHFVSYHSRLPLVSGFTADREAIDATSQAAVDELATDLLAEDPGRDPEDALRAAETLTIGRFANHTRYFASYPEDIRMLGVSFNTATLRSGTLVAAELSHHFNWPVQIPREEVLTASLSPIGFTDQFGQTSLGEFGASEVVRGFADTGKTQLAVNLTQLFGRRLGASQSLLSVGVGWVHFHDLPASHPQDDDSWGYRLLGQLTYDGVLGGLMLQPYAVWTHDVSGDTPGPGGAFLERRKTISVGLAADYTNRWTANLAYVAFLGDNPLDLAADRDFVQFSVGYYY